MKRSGMKRLTYEEAMEKKRIAQEKKKAQPPKPKVVKHPTILGIPSTRYTGIKGCLWTIFSRYTRKRDFQLYDGQCVSCRRRLDDWKDGDAGHYVSVTRGNALTMWHEQNVNLQCKRCNNPDWSPDSSIPYGIEVDRRYGAGTALMLEELGAQRSKEYSYLEYLQQIQIYKDKFAKL